MTDITELAQRMKAAAEKATPGEWWADEVKNEGCYGSGDDCVEGFTSYAIYGSDGQTLFDSLNSDAACICEEYDGEGHVAWDETAQRNAEFIALANPANVLALVEALEKVQGMEAYWKVQCRGITDHCEVLQARIAELESCTVTVKQGEVLVTVAGFTGCGKSAIAGEIEIAMKAIGLPVTWANGDSEKRMTGADWLTAIEMYKPTVRIVEVNIPRAAGIKVEAE
ncbi:TPA: ead/Ea22-like family protein [Klebsiella pneumoniae]|uniref:ead/Ea22-like family protein n=1 Tax=Klebsiella pneumoniae TaxID=573 RepID=UPI0023806EC0|nr:ead/Ea22-like family protein [Klebsiella pneumoniae]HBT0081272.1 ead/Ea22-like family protein [Klebsiella pneumoniae]HBT0127925.1 ead/Ea22-like family protein [Klebsiella pneumoniae]HBT0348425.1 ead/Ea22-like family protein [Klebsiella pneumoniae]HBT0353931.1 ead/Ea22-like family protein [Klebsiella pneumoniae]HBT0413469.1 ead/Ea22-like family protein [Klebsiella pneumoniae]